MIVKLYDWEIKQAIAEYIKRDYGMDFDTENIESSVLKYYEVEKVYKKHKNGRLIKDKHGFPKVDWENSPRVTKHADFDEGSSVTFWLLNLEGE